MGSTPKGISGSRASSIIGMNPWSTRIDTWLQIMSEVYPGYVESRGYKLPQRQSNAYIDFGLAFEEDVIKLCEHEQETIIRDKEIELIHNKYNYLTCHLDGIYYFHKKSKRSGGITSYNVIHEGKTTSIGAFNRKFDEKNNYIPEYYYYQVQHQMIVSEIYEAILSVLVFPVNQPDIPKKISEIPTTQWSTMLYDMGLFKQFNVEADFVLHKMMIEAYREFWMDNIINMKEPEPQNYDDIKKLVPKPEGSMLATPEIVHMCNEYRHINSEKNRVEKIQDGIKAKIINYMLHADKILEKSSVGKYVLKNEQGKNIATFNGKMLRVN